jgi:uncharacterized cupin superfamily protein
MTVNLFHGEWTGGRERPGWQWRYRSIQKEVGATKLGASLYELAPGQRSFPYHWHVIQEEWMIVLEGEPTLRHPGGERRLVAGDCVVFKRGEEGAHQVRNDTDEPVRLLMLSSDRDGHGEICFYPDGGKVGVFGEGLRKILDESAELDYFHNEEPPAA